MTQRLRQGNILKTRLACLKACLVVGWGFLLWFFFHQDWLVLKKWPSSPFRLRITHQVVLYPRAVAVSSWRTTDHNHGRPRWDSSHPISLLGCPTCIFCLQPFRRWRGVIHPTDLWHTCLRMDKLKGSLQTSLKQSPNLSESSYVSSLARIRSLLWSDLNTSTSHVIIHAVEWYWSSWTASLLVDETKLQDALQKSQNASAATKGHSWDQRTASPTWSLQGHALADTGTSALTLSLNLSPHITMTYLLI